MLRTVAIAGLAVLLVASLTGANAAYGVERGPLDEDRTSRAIDRADVADVVRERAVQQLTAEVNDTRFSEAGVPVEDIVRDAVDRAWVQAQIDRNVAGVYAYIRGEQDTVRIELAVGTLRNETREAIRAHTDFADIAAETSERNLSAFVESEAAYEQERQALRASVLEELGVAPEAGFGQEELATMLESEAGYRSQQATFRERIVEELMNESNASTGFGHERLAALLESEESYHAERAAFREAQKERINNESPRDLSDETLEAAYERRQDEIIANLTEQFLDELEFEDLPEGVEPPVEEMANTTAHALAGNLSYGTFTNRYDAYVAQVRSDLETHVGTSGTQYHEDLREEMDVRLPDEAPGRIESDVADLETLVLTATTTDMSYETFVAEYEAIAERIVEKATTAVWENQEEYRDELDAHLPERPNVPDPIVPELSATESLLIEAVLTDLEYEEFNRRLEAIEANATDAYVDHVFDEELAGDRTQQLTADVERQAGNELALARTAAGVTGPVATGLLLVAAILGGAITAVARTYAGASLTVGLSSAVAGGISAAGVHLTMAQLPAIGPRDGELLAELAATLLAPLRTQSMLLLGLGIGLLGIGAVLAFTDIAPWADADDDVPDDESTRE